MQFAGHNPTAYTDTDEGPLGLTNGLEAVAQLPTAHDLVMRRLFYFRRGNC
jgi:hypothetical protein